MNYRQLCERARRIENRSDFCRRSGFPARTLDRLVADVEHKGNVKRSTLDELEAALKAHRPKLKPKADAS